MALGEDDRAMSDFNQAASLNKSKDLFTLVSKKRDVLISFLGLSMHIVLSYIQTAAGARCFEMCS